MKKVFTQFIVSGGRELIDSCHELKFSDHCPKECAFKCKKGDSILKFLIILFTALVLPWTGFSQIVSAPGGGLWNVGGTWIGGFVPGVGDSVVIASDVMVNISASCAGLYVTPAGILGNKTTSSYTLNVNGALTNAGIIRNNGSYSFVVNITGNVANHGEWSNFITRLTGTTNQEIAASQPFTGDNFQKNATSGNAIATTGLSFIGTSVNFSNDTLEFSTGNSLSIEGGYLGGSRLYKESLPALDITMTEGAYFNYPNTANAPEINLYGTVLIGGTSTFTGIVNNHGVLVNRSTSHYTLDINGDFINYSSVLNFAPYYFTLNITGNVANHGEWSNRTTRLTGTANQEIAATQPFTGHEFHKNTTSGNAIATTGLSFIGTTINFSNDTLEFSTGNSLSIEGGYLGGSRLYKESLPALDITMTDGAYFYLTNTVNAPEINLFGTVLIGGTSTFTGIVNNHGVLVNRSTTHYTLDINGDFINYSSVLNFEPYYFTLNITGNVANHGEWNNRITKLTGTTNQEIAATQPFTGHDFHKNATSGNAIATTGLSFIGTSINFNNDTLEFTTGNSISLEGGSLSGSMLYKESLPALDITMTEGAYFYLTNTVNAPEINLYGTVLIGGTSTFTGIVNNYGELVNRSTTHYTLGIDGDLINHSTIRNSSPYIFTLNITGNIGNHGSWANQTTNLNGTEDHYLTFTKKFEGTNFSNTNSSADLISATDLIFTGTNITLSGGLLTMPEKGLLSVQNGYMINATVGGTDVHFHGLNSYCQTVTFNTNLTTHGDVRLRSSVLFSGNLTNEGTLGNSANTYETTVSGDLMNNGSIASMAPYQFRLNVLGDIYNSGSWTNQWTLLDGAGDQSIFIQNSNSIVSQIRLKANFTGSGLIWYGPSGSLVGNPNFSGASTLQLNFLNPVTDLDAGEYYCKNSLNEQSRSIFINTMTTTFNELDLTVTLEGPFNGTDMNTSLNSGGFLPLDQPYFDFPWVYPGGESVGAIPSPDVVDWVLVELRDAASPSTATNSERVARYAGLLLKNGKILGSDGTSNIEFSEEISDGLYLVIRHRNHLDIMSATALTENSGVYSYNFTLNSGQAYGTGAQTELATGVWGMVTGDGDGYGAIDLQDKALWGQEVGNIGYYRSDYDLGGEVNNQDKNDIWYPRMGEQSQVPE